MAQGMSQTGFTPSVTQDFMGGAHPLVALSPDLQSRLKNLHASLKGSWAQIEEGYLRLPLNDAYLSPVVPIVLRAVAKDPSLKEGIVFIDQGQVRSYNDVVWPLEERVLKLARKMYADQKSDHADIFNRIVITPPGVEIQTPDTLRCSPLSAKDKKDRTLKFIPEITLLGTSWARTKIGQKFVVQVKDSLLDSRGEKPHKAEIMFMRFKAANHGVVRWDL